MARGKDGRGKAKASMEKASTAKQNEALEQQKALVGEETAWKLEEDEDALVVVKAEEDEDAE